jgi:hypothetical protein
MPLSNANPEFYVKSIAEVRNSPGTTLTKCLGK